MKQPKITRDSLMTLEAYAKARPEFRKRVIEHKKLRTLALGDHVTLIFEDELTIRYQIQEMLRIEKIFEEDGILHELESYTPLVPDGSNFKATMMIEYDEPAERKKALAQLIGVEDKVWVQVEGSPKVYAIADEDLERENDEKTSSVHFLRFELSKDMCEALKYGVTLSVGIDHDFYRVAISPLPADHRNALIADLS
ncbi:MAG: DUF3501 family protein [Betaproteobacteria bacterium]|nr:DUF3501 family protein [Pseudomonadota bacterium]NBO03026.1 DUF3501 family protein [Betaproteobacteria bacterium]NBP34127.1 DUF3501 family protein [Betaproteobacteria bacterium]NBP38215.1 DUF3501 family protein [Betaproteobacteria bacterium]NBQ77495.1 DUF3501 family protein [Betaproteobacteria bacterium]